MSSDIESTRPINLFYSYANEDELLCKELEKHLSLLKRQGVITEWHHRNIRIGADRTLEIDNYLNTAHIILLLISPDFLASDYCYGIEMKQALERHVADTVRVVPVILRPVDLEGTPFSNLQALPSDNKPITTWSDRDTALLNVAQGIRRVVNELTKAHITAISSWPIISSPDLIQLSNQNLDVVNTKVQEVPSYSSILLRERANVFLFNQPLPKSTEFYGRTRERQTLLNRTWNSASTSIVGPRRIGKTWLIHYLKLIASKELGSRFLVGYLDATASKCSTVTDFVKSALEALNIQLYPSKTHNEGLILLEQEIQALISRNLVPVLCIDEFEGFGDRREFDIHFFTTLRALTQIGLCLVVTSKIALIDFVGEYGKTSGFFNVFEQITIKSFNYKEAERFVQSKGEKADLTEYERQKILFYGQKDGEYRPIRLQLAGKMLLEDKLLTMQEDDQDYYRPKDQDYWQEFENRLEEVYQGVVR